MAQFVDPSDLDKWLDVGQMASPQDTKRAQMPQAPTSMTSPLNAYQSVDFTEEQQRSMQPSHDYASFKQQTGLPTQPTANGTPWLMRAGTPGAHIHIPQAPPAG